MQYNVSELLSEYGISDKIREMRVSILHFVTRVTGSIWLLLAFVLLLN